METIVLKTPITHNPGCALSGTNKCRDDIHLKTEWTRADCDLLTKILDTRLKEYV